MRMIVAVVTTFLAIPPAESPAAAPSDAVIRIHGSVGPVALGMSRSEALTALGPPAAAHRRSLRFDGGRLRVGLDRSGRRVTGLAVDRRGVCTARGLCLGRRGGLTLLRRWYGPSLRLWRDEGHHLYTLRRRVGTRVVETTFDVPTGANDRPRDVVFAISMTDVAR